MKIALVVHDCRRSLGHGRYVIELASRFCRQHEVHVFANTFDDSLPPKVTRHRVWAIRRNAFSTVLSFILPATVAVGRGFDIVHAQGLTILRFNVITAHMCNRAWFDARRSTDLFPSWRQRAFDRVISPLEDAAFGWSHRAEVIAISERIRQDLDRLYGRSERVEVIHHGVDVDTFTPDNRSRYRAEVRRSVGVDEGALVALFVGDLRKGLAITLAALADVPGLSLVAVSRSDPAPYRAEVARLGLSGRVFFPGPSECIEGHYAAADMFVFPSPYEPFGLVVLEAMASGVPVVTSRQAGVAELIEPGQTGLVVEDARDGHALAAAMRRLTENPDGRRRMGEAARARAQALSWDQVARRTLGVYERAISRPRG